MIKKILKKMKPVLFKKLITSYDKYKNYKIQENYFNTTAKDPDNFYLLSINILNQNINKTVNKKIILSIISKILHDNKDQRVETALFIALNLKHSSLVIFTSELIKNGLYKEAYPLCKRLYDMNQKDPNIIQLYFEVLFNFNNVELIEKTLEELKSNELYNIFLSTKANYLIKNNNFQNAKTFLDDAVFYYPDSIEKFIPLYKLINDYEKTWEIYTTSSYSKKIKNNVELIEIALKLKKYNFAENMILSVLKTETNQNIINKIYSMYITMLIETCREKSFIFMIIKDAINIAPFEFKYYQRLIELEEDTFKVLNLIENISSFKPSYYIVKGRTYLFLNDIKAAVEIFKLGYKRFTTNDRIIHWYAHCLSHYGDFNEAETFFLKSLSSEFNVSTLIDYFRHLVKYEKYNECKLLMDKYSFIFTNNKYKIQTQTSRRIYNFGILNIEDAWKSWEERHSTEFFKRISILNQINFYTNLKQVNRKMELLLIAEYGPGDEIRWTTIYNNIKDYYPNLSISCEPRFYELLKNSFKDINFISTRRQHRGFIEKENLHKYTELPSMQMVKAFDNTLWKYINNHNPNVMFVADCLKTIRKNRESFSKQDNKLIARKEKIAKWNEYLSNNNYDKKPIIGISWRSSIMSYARDLHYFGQEDIIEIINTYKKDFNFFNLQYDECDEELEEIHKKTGVKIINPKNINQKDDLEDVAAIMSLLDIIIAPATTVVEMAGSVGTTTFLYNNSAELNWRVLENDKDIWHESITHFYNNKDLMTKINITLKKEKNVQ